jgi:hypothetical protein
MPLPTVLAALAPPLLLLLAACAAPTPRADPASDAPEGRVVATVARHASYAQALAAWRTPEDLEAWIGAHFEYDMSRALALSESARAAGRAPPIHEPAAFFERPEGICVDLARFAVESLRRLAPGLKPRYLMIEFDPARLSGQVLRRHWIAMIERDGQHWFLADSKRPGTLAGPYPSVDAFVADYARYRGRTIVATGERDSFQRATRSVQRQRAGS